MTGLHRLCPGEKKDELQQLLAHLSIYMCLDVCDLFFPVVDLIFDS